MKFQCSSASRKFLNRAGTRSRSYPVRVSVLFSEPKIPQSNCPRLCRSGVYVSVLFSEPKIPQYVVTDRSDTACTRVSVLFSEPKIPQSYTQLLWDYARYVSVLFSEPKIPQYKPRRAVNSSVEVSVLFSEPKIPQSHLAASTLEQPSTFQCSSASRKFLNRLARVAGRIR